MAAYSVVFRKSVEKDLKKLPEERIPQILEKIAELADTPIPHDAKKLTGSEHLYRIRAGDYRIVYEVLHETKCITIFYIRHRRSVYREL
ncbi:type II toxin-antitoxin system RelE/ParE family toxin [Methanosarcina sp. KYL-1]|uniref:type II toxin-antitoxin system RelE family toxin n=1 Tax=Methanosarcina sp. KYL-1 TaxID=2602068 RepID=UPI0021015BBA|nr:type II toxin-antitoxin system RelE/ParE family toxin [Methanosarcina sp. KYL-1]MCQ1536137.1 type II toxin-antitoxin system RelE/ParE family toxin [Methanosarcina sp. KYL-1]